MHCDIVQPYPSIFIQFAIISYPHLIEIHVFLLDGYSLYMFQDSYQRAYDSLEYLKGDKEL